MNGIIRKFSVLSGLACCCMTMSTLAAEAGQTLEYALSGIEQQFDQLSFATPNKRTRKAGFEQLVEVASQLVSANPTSAEALTWQGIVLSTYAGEVSAFSAMKYANAARASLQQAESINAMAMHGSVYASLGALYSQVPGGMIGFGDDDLALDYLKRALEISPNDLDANYFLADLLVEQGKGDDARQVLTRALAAPAVTGRPLFDSARRNEMQAMLDDLD